MQSAMLCTLRSLGGLRELVVLFRPSLLPLLNSNRRYLCSTTPCAEAAQVPHSLYRKDAHHRGNMWRKHVEKSDLMWCKEADDWRKRNQEDADKLRHETAMGERFKVRFLDSLAKFELISILVVCSIKTYG